MAIPTWFWHHVKKSLRRKWVVNLRGVVIIYAWQYIQMVDSVKAAELDKDILFRRLEDLIKLNLAVPNQYWNCVFRMITERRDNNEKIFD